MGGGGGGCGWFWVTLKIGYVCFEVTTIWLIFINLLFYQGNQGGQGDQGSHNHNHGPNAKRVRLAPPHPVGSSSGMSSQQQQPQQQQQPEFHHVQQQQQQQQQQQHVSQPGMIYNSTSNAQQTPNYSQRFWYNLSYDLCDIHRSDFSVTEERRLASECQSVPNIRYCIDCILSLLCDVFSLSAFLFFRYNICQVCEYGIMNHISVDSKHYHVMLYIYVSDRYFSNHGSFWSI